MPDSTTLAGVDWQRPDLTAWVDQAHRELAALGKPSLLVAHSFGCLTAATLAAEQPRRVAGMVFVAPADPRRFAADGGLLDDPGRSDRRPVISVADILPEALPPTVPSVLLASRNDPWLGFRAALELSETWNSRFVDLGEVGHVNVESGFGPWPALLQQLRHWRGQPSPDFHEAESGVLSRRRVALPAVEAGAFTPASHARGTLRSLADR